MSSNEDQQISANKLFAAIQKMKNSFYKKSTTELTRFCGPRDSPVLAVLETDRLNLRGPRDGHTLDLRHPDVKNQSVQDTGLTVLIRFWTSLPSEMTNGRKRMKTEKKIAHSVYQRSRRKRLKNILLQPSKTLREEKFGGDIRFRIRRRQGLRSWTTYLTPRSRNS